MKPPLEDIIKRASRDRPPTDEEIERIWARVRAATGGEASGDAELIALAPEPHAERRLPRTRWLVGVAAAVIAALGLLEGSGLGESAVVNDVVGVPSADDGPQPTPPAVVRVCGRSVAELGNAIGAWDTLSDWAASGDGRPDVGALTQIALGDVVELDPTASDAAATLASELVDRTASGRLVHDRATHEAAVRSGIEQIVASLARLDSGGECDLGPLAAVLAEGGG